MAKNITPDELAETVALDTISRIERESTDEEMRLREAARVCREVAQQLLDRAELFESEAEKA